MTSDANPQHDLRDLSFEDAYDELQTIVAQLERGDLSLDESVTLYARGQALAQHCHTQLDAAELRVQQITDDGEILPLD